jgi:hypothetical protein
VAEGQKVGHGSVSVEDLRILAGGGGWRAPCYKA